MKRFLVVNHTGYQYHFVDTEEELKKHIHAAFEDCENDVDKVYEEYDFIDLHNEKQIGFKINFEVDYEAFDEYITPINSGGKK